MVKRKTKRSRKKIVGFSWKTRSGFRQALYERDFDSRKQFLNERRSFKRHGIRIRDMKKR